MLIEQAVYAFGLLEALARVEMPFVFKGGSCLMLLLEHPMRLSTDIDIIVKPGTDVNAFVQAASEIFPFEDCEEQVRKGRNNIEKKHFKFKYSSPIAGHNIFILLDILYEQEQYEKLVWKEIRNDLLLTEGESLNVQMPSINGILGDKLAAFAPHTTGVPFHVGKDMEIIKQMYDIATLIDCFDDYLEVYDTYTKIVAAEIGYRGLNINAAEALKDTLKTSLSLASRGRVLPDDYEMLKNGIRDVRGHIYGETFSAEIAAVLSPKIMYMAACLMTRTPFEKVIDPRQYLHETFEESSFRSLKYLKKYDETAYAYAIKTDKLMLGKIQL